MGNIYKASTSKAFTKIPNILIRNKGISDGTFRLICWINSHSEGFNISFASIRSHLGYGREKLRRIISEAEQNDYLIRIQTRNQKGQIDWEYHIFSDTEECNAFKSAATQQAYPGGANPSVVQPSVDDPVYGSTVGGSSAPHKKIQFKENKIKEEQWEESPPTSTGIIEVEVIPEIKNPVVWACGIAEAQTTTFTENQNLALRSEYSAPLAHAESLVDRIKRVYQETGIKPTIPMELQAWAEVDLGRDLIALYRKSGRITTTSHADINREFALYVASQWGGKETKDISYSYPYISKMEQNPTRWAELAALVIKWQASKQTGDRNLNITKEVEKTARTEEVKQAIKPFSLERFSR